MTKGWIKLHRKFLEWEWYDSTNVKVVFLHCLFRANYKDQKYQGKIIKRGQFATGRADFSDEVGLSVQQVRTAWEKLELTGEITMSTTNRGTVVTVCNYDTYQILEDVDNQQSNQQDNHLDNQQVTSTNKTDAITYGDEQPASNQQVTSKQPASNQQVTTIKEGKNIKKEKNKTLLSDQNSDDFDRDGNVSDKVDWTTVRFHERVRERYGHHKNVKQATLENWRDPIRLMKQEDGLTFDQIWSYIKFIFQDEFWRDTVKSTSGLRNNWEEIDSAINRTKNQNGEQEKINWGL